LQGIDLPCGIFLGWRITTSGVLLAEFIVPTASSNMNGIAIGPHSTRAKGLLAAGRIDLPADIAELGLPANT
jgi:hypothetical protein